LKLVIMSLFHKPQQTDSVCFKFLNTEDRFKFVLCDSFKTLIDCDKCTECAASLLAAPLLKFFSINPDDFRDNTKKFIAEDAGVEGVKEFESDDLHEIEDIEAEDVEGFWSDEFFSVSTTPFMLRKFYLLISIE
jgi:hypothetical protein